MKKFIFAYHGTPKFETQEDGEAHMQKWHAWSESLGTAVVDPGMPVGPSMTVTAQGVIEGGGANPLSGITIVQAENIQVAINMAQSCPHIDLDGSIEVAEAINMSM